jgi:hypothetical protein
MKNKASLQGTRREALGSAYIASRVREEVGLETLERGKGGK